MIKRFYSQVSIEPSTKTGSDHFIILLDDQPLRTPDGTLLTLPQKSIAEKIAQEWRYAGKEMAGEEIQPTEFPFFSTAVTITDRICPHRQILGDALLRYVDTDMICYRADNTQPDLQNHQARHWDEWLAWASTQFGTSPQITTGLMPITQPAPYKAKIAASIASLSDWHFFCLYSSTRLVSSFILGYGFTLGVLGRAQIYALGFLDELYQNQKWGRDPETIARHAQHQIEIKHLASCLTLL